MSHIEKELKLSFVEGSSVTSKGLRGLYVGVDSFIPCNNFIS